MDAYFDIFSGISGNMILGAFIDLGLDISDLKEELNKLKINDEYKIKVDKVKKQGIGGTYVEVELLEHEYNSQNSDHSQVNDEHIHSHKQGNNSQHNHSHDHKHDHENNEHNKNHDHHENHDHNDHKHNHSHKINQQHKHGRNLTDIQELIDNSSLSNSIKERSKEIFMNLAQAEASIHQTEINKIHFHEVGAVDAIVDIVGSVIAIELLDIENIYASRLNTGTGFVNCDHGKMPVPAPATMELLQGIPVYSTGINKELVTPTGAAIIKTLAKSFGLRSEMEIEKTAYGAGSYDLEIPNLLRINLGKIKNQKKKVT